MAIELEKLDFDAFLERELFHLYQEAHSDAKKFWSSRRPIDEAKDAIKKMLVAHYTPKPAVLGDGEMREKLADILRYSHYSDEEGAGCPVAMYGGSIDDCDCSIKESVDEIMQLLASQAAAAQERTAREAEIALARKVLAVSSGVVKHRGYTQAKRLKLLTHKMNEIIPDELGITIELAAQPKEQQGEV